MERPSPLMYHPDNPDTINAMLDLIMESDDYQHMANAYAMSVVHYYFGDWFNDFWFADWIGTENFRGGRYPDGHKMKKSQLKRYERMYDVYWAAHQEFFNSVIMNIAHKSLLDANRTFYSHTMWTRTSWEQYSKRAKKTHINHYTAEVDA